MLGPDTDEVTATCTPNKIGGSLPGWVLEPPVDIMNVQCSRWECILYVYVYTRNYGMDTESLKFIFISKRVVSLYQGLNQVR